jgi:Flp pilus assembly protein TadG
VAWLEPLHTDFALELRSWNVAMSDCHVHRRPSRGGAATVELAVVLPVFLIFMFGIWVYGHAQMVSNMLKGATRTAARYGATEGVTSAQAEARIRQILGAAVDPSVVSVQIKDASAYDGGNAFPKTGSAMEALPDLELTEATTRQLFMIRATVNYNAVAIVPSPWFDNVQLAGQSFMRHE